MRPIFKKLFSEIVAFVILDPLIPLPKVGAPADRV